jgi:predicted aspartyl protease
MKRYWYSSACVLALLWSPVAHSVTDWVGTRAAHENEICFDLYNDHLVVVQGSVGSIEGVPVLLDTGKSPTAISREVAERLGLHGDLQRLLFSNGTIQAESVTLPTLSIGTLHVSGARVLVQDLSYFEKQFGISLAAIIGLDVLGTSSFVIDYQKRKIILGRTTLGKKRVPFATRVPFLTIDARVDGQVLRLLVDSGMSGLLVYDKSFNSMRPLMATNSDPLISTALGPMRTAWYQASEVSLGSQTLGPRIMLLAYAAPNPQYKFDGLLGFVKMGFRKVWFDFDDGVLAWE